MSPLVDAQLANGARMASLTAEAHPPSRTASHRALIVGPERSLCERFRVHLTRANFDVYEIADGTAAIERTRQDRFDLIVLDQVLGDLDGMTVCRVIRSNGHNMTTPIVLVVSGCDVSNLALGLESGADHCLQRHVDPRELAARLRALLRRTLPPVQVQDRGRRPIRMHGLTIDPERRCATVRGAAVDLTEQEFELLYALASRPGMVFSRAVLLARISTRDGDVTDRTIDTAISRLRRKIECVTTPELIRTVHGIGYMFHPG